jgi:hypothetical protein
MLRFESFRRIILLMPLQEALWEYVKKQEELKKEVKKK